MNVIHPCHQAQKKRLKRQWKKLKDKQVLLKSQSVALGKPLDQTRLNLISENLSTVKQIRNNENAAFGAKNEHLWLGDFNTVRNSCKREVFGFVNAATMSYGVGACVGFGFVTLKGKDIQRSYVKKNLNDMGEMGILKMGMGPIGLKEWKLGIFKSNGSKGKI